MKIIMLDIDGVLNTYQHATNGHNFSKSACKNLNSILDRVPDAKIVISSAWRHNGIDICRKVLKDNGINPDKVIGLTGNEHGSRGYQIQCWLDRNPKVTQFVIIDDASDFDNLMNRLVKPNSFIGLTEKEADQAVQILNR